MKVAASTWVLPLQLGRELGLPSPTQSPVSALGLYTRTVDNKNTRTPPHTISDSPAVVAIQKEGMSISIGHSQDSSHSAQQETEAQRRL